MKKILFAAFFLAVAPRICNATIYFQNTGTTNGWTTLWHEDEGSLTQVVTPTYKGPEAVDCRTIYRPTYRGRYHTELRKGGMAALGMDRYYGFAFYLPPNWEFDDQSYNIQQFIASVDGCSGGQPATMTHIQNHALITRITTGPNGCTRSQQSFTVTTNITAGQWHRVVIHGNWQATNTGVFEFWYDGVRKVNQVNVPTIPNDNTVFNLAVGNYSNGWHDDGMMVGTQGTRDIFIDQVRVTDNYAEADPAAWSGPADGGQFAMSVDSSSDSLTPGSNIVYNITVIPFNGFSSNVTFSLTGMPPNVTANFNPVTVGASNSSVLTLNAASNAVPGNYNLTLIGASGALGVTNTIPLTVNELAPSPDTLFVAIDNAWVLRSAGSTVEDSSQVLQVKRLADSNTRVTYTRFNLGSFFAHHSVTGITEAKLRLYIPTATSGGSLSVYGLMDNIGGTNGYDALWTSAGMTWNNQPAKGAPTNDIPGNANALPNANTTVSLGSAPIPATAGEMDISLDISTLTNFLSNDSNQQITLLFVNNSATIVSFASQANTGGYLQPELELVSPVSDFGLSISPSSQNVNTGSNVTFTVTVTGSNGFGNDVTLDMGDLPPGVLANFSTNTVTGSGAATLTLSAAPDMSSAATYVIPVTATSGALQHTGSISLTVYVTDSDNDGIPDWWMLQYFGHPTGQAADESFSTDDTDGDGVSNYAEFLAGTDPTNPQSYLHVVSSVQQSNDESISWSAVGGHSYVVQAASGLGGTNGFTDISPVISVDGDGESTNSFVEPGGATNGNRFYRIRLSP